MEDKRNSSGREHEAPQSSSGRQWGTELSKNSLSVMIREVVKDVFREQMLEMLSPQQALKASSEPHKAKRKRSPSPCRRARSPTSDDASDEVSDDASDEVSDDESDEVSIQAKAQKRFLPTSSQEDDSLPSPSQSESEEGELSEDEEDSSFNEEDRLCPVDLYPRVLYHAAKVLDLEVPTIPPQASTSSSRAQTYPQGPPQPLVVPFPEALEHVFSLEWENITRPRSHKDLDKLYTLPDPIMKKLKVPTVDAPVVALSLATTLPSEGESGPKDRCDRRVEKALKRNFECASLIFRASVASSIFSRAAYVWAEELASSKSSFSRRSRRILKRMVMSAAAAADCAHDSLILAARSMATSVLARRHLWLRHWQVDSASYSKIVNLPFKGNKLFGEDLEPFLIEDENKRKVLPSNKKKPSKKGQSFRGNSRGFKPRAGFQHHKPKWERSKVPFKYRKSGGPSASSSQTRKPFKDQHPFQGPSEGGVLPLALSEGPPRVAEGGTSRRGIDSRLAQASKSKRQRVASPVRHLSIVSPMVGTVGAGFIHPQGQGPNISNKSTNAEGSGSGCSSVSMAPGTPLHFSTHNAPSDLPQESTGSQGRSQIGSSSLVKAPMAPSLSSTQSGNRVEDPSQVRSLGTHNPSPSGAVPTDSLVVEWEQLARKGYSDQVIATLLAANKRTWRRFRSWRLSKGLSPVYRKHEHYIEFLQDVLGRVLAP